MVQRLIRAGWAAVAVLSAAPLAAHAAQPGSVSVSPAPTAGVAPSLYQTPRVPPQPLRRDQVSVIMATLKDAESHGFKATEFYPASLDTLLYASDPGQRTQGDALLRASIIRYARAQHGLRLNNWPKNWASMKPAAYDAENDFNLAVQQDRVAQWIESLPPPFDRYRALRTALVRYKAIAAAGGWPTIDAGPVLKLGSSGPRVVALRQRLMAEEPSLAIDTASDEFDEGLATALQFYQRRNGFEANGQVGRLTLEALNVPAQSRVLQIIANMERWRWEPRLWPASRIEVNIAAAEMTLFEENQLTLEMRAAPGRPDDQTPLLYSQVQSILLNPPWNVPQGIMQKEYLPKEAAHPGYLAAHGFRFIDTPDGGRRLQQKSGAKSALGQIKFDFPNNFAVYLHDTPSHKAFGSDSRNVSHGCVRLERPFDLASKLLAGDADWTPDRVQDVVDDGKTTRVALDRQMPVFLMYWTVYPDVRGRMDFRNDVYDWDSQLLGLIDASR